MCVCVDRKCVYRQKEKESHTSFEKKTIPLKVQVERHRFDPIYPTRPLGQDMTQGQFLSGV